MSLTLSIHYIFFFLKTGVWILSFLKITRQVIVISITRLTSGGNRGGVENSGVDPFPFFFMYRVLWPNTNHWCTRHRWPQNRSTRSRLWCIGVHYLLLFIVVVSCSLVLYWCKFGLRSPGCSYILLLGILWFKRQNGQLGQLTSTGFCPNECQNLLGFVQTNVKT